MNPVIAMPALDEEGYLVEPRDWNEAIAEELAFRLGIVLGDDHWDVIRFMRGMYEEHQVAPDARHVIKHLEIRYPGEGRKRLFDLFPLRICRTSVQDCWHEAATGMEYGLSWLHPTSICTSPVLHGCVASVQATP